MTKRIVTRGYAGSGGRTAALPEHGSYDSILSVPCGVAEIVK